MMNTDYVEEYLRLTPMEEIEKWEVLFNENPSPEIEPDKYFSAYEILKRCIKDGFDVNSKDENGNTLLHEFAQHPDLSIIKALIKHKADISKLNDEGYPPIFYATRVPNARALIKAGADVNYKAKDGMTCFSHLKHDLNTTKKTLDFIFNERFA